MSLEDIEKQLYKLKSIPAQGGEIARTTKKQAIRKEKKTPAETATEPPQKEKIYEGWTEIVSEEEMKAAKEHFPKWLKVLLIGMGAVTITTLGLVIFFIFGLGGKSADIEITVNGPEEIERGVPFDIIVGFHNQGDVILNDVALEIQLPSGIANVNSLNDQTRIEDTIGDVGGGSFTKKTYSVLTTGEKDSLQKIRAVLVYRIGNSRFEKEAFREMKVRDVAITLEVNKPDHALSGSSFEMNVTYKNVSGFDFSNVVVVAQYPSSFAFQSSSIQSKSLNNRWEVGEVKSGSSGGFIIEGSVNGGTENVVNIPITVYTNFLGKDYLITETLASVTVAPSPVNLTIRINSRDDYVAKIGDALKYTIAYENKSGIALADVVVKANIIGELFDMTSIDTTAAIEPLTQTLVWNVSRVPALKLIDAGASGAVEFSVKLKNQFPIRRLNDKNFTLRVAASIDSPTVPYYLAAEKTSAGATRETKVSGLVFFDTQAFYRDAAAQVVNSGAFPPKVNQSTEYTIHWIIRNYATDIRNVSVKSFLESGVDWTGVVKSNVETVPVFNERTREVTWNIETISATAGVLSDPIETVFQVKAIPNITQANQFQPLVGISRFEATDDFTDTELKSSDIVLTTALPDDTTVRQEEGKVIQ